MPVGSARPAVLAAIALVLAGAALDLALVDHVPRGLWQCPAPAQPESPLAGLLRAEGAVLAPEIRREVAGAIEEEALAAGFDPLFVVAVMAVESRFDHAAVSRRGARGLMQLRPRTFAWLKHKTRLQGPDAPTDNHAFDVRLAVRYLANLKGRFGDRDLALIAYNAGPTKLRRFLRRGNLPDALLRYPRAVNREHGRLAAIFAPGTVAPELASAGAPAGARL